MKHATMALSAAVLGLAIALSGCVTTDTRPIVPVDITAIEGEWEGRSKRWSSKNKLRIYKDDEGRAIAYYCWGGWCRSTKGRDLRNSVITPTTVEFDLTRSHVTYTLHGDVLKATFDAAGTQWDHSHELRRK